MKLAVILHAYYPELRAELDACLANLDEPYDLYVTDAGTDNRGFDIWPFLRTLDTLDLTRYTHVLKLHTKRDVMRPVGFNGVQVSGATWRDWLLSFVRTSAAEQTIDSDAVQEILKEYGYADDNEYKEALDDVLKQSGVDNETTFGYQEGWYNERYRNSRVSGFLDPNADGVYCFTSGSDGYKFVLTQINRSDIVEKIITPTYENGTWVMKDGRF